MERDNSFLTLGGLKWVSVAFAFGGLSTSLSLPCVFLIALAQRPWGGGHPGASTPTKHARRGALLAGAPRAPTRPAVQLSFRDRRAPQATGL